MLQDCQLVSVVESLKFVFGEENWKVAPQALEEFQNTYINFSHWVLMDCDIKQHKRGLEQLR